MGPWVGSESVYGDSRRPIETNLLINLLNSSWCGVLRKDSHDWHLHVFLSQVRFVRIAYEEKRNERHQQEKQMVLLAALLPRRNLGWVSFRVIVVGTSVQPVSIRIYMELLKVPEFVKRVVLQVVRHYHLIVSGFRLVSKSIELWDSGRLVWHLVFGVNEPTWGLWFEHNSAHHHLLLLIKLSCKILRTLSLDR